jgi:PTH1 family peptidyl-tRNA hydrolase
MLIVGLGNPGKEYESTRHNMGYIFIDNFASSKGVKIDKKKFNGLYQEITINNEKVILLKPLSYMNLSGEVVEKYVSFFKIDIKDILIINDDLDLDFCKIRLRRSGSSGGHNGLKNIALHLHTNEFKRLKIGISNNKLIETKDYVLGKFSKEEKETIEELKITINNLLDDYLEMDFEKLMSKYN